MDAVDGGGMDDELDALRRTPHIFRLPYVTLHKLVRCLEGLHIEQDRLVSGIRQGRRERCAERTARSRDQDPHDESLLTSSVY